MKSKTNVLSIWKGKFSDFLKFFSVKVETIFWEIEAKHQKLFKSKFGHRKLFRKWFWSYIELKNQYCGRLKIGFFFVFCKFLIDEVEMIFWETQAKFSNFLNQNLVIESFLENGFEATLSSNKRMFWAFEKGIFLFFANFWVTKLKLFSGKARQCC